MTKVSKLKKTISKPKINSDSDEIGIIGISLALTALSASIIFGAETYIFIKVISLIIYVLGGLSTSLLYYTFLTHKFPETMNKWQSKGGMNIRGCFWIFLYYSKLLIRQLFTMKDISFAQTRELGYLTILAMLFILWITFSFPMLVIFIN